MSASWPAHASMSWPDLALSAPRAVKHFGGVVEDHRFGLELLSGEPGGDVLHCGGRSARTISLMQIGQGPEGIVKPCAWCTVDKVGWGIVAESRWAELRSQSCCRADLRTSADDPCLGRGAASSRPTDCVVRDYSWTSTSVTGAPICKPSVRGRQSRSLVGGEGRTSPSYPMSVTKEKR